MLIYGDCPYVLNKTVKIKPHKCEEYGNTTVCHVRKEYFNSEHLKDNYLDPKHGRHLFSFIEGFFFFLLLSFIVACMSIDWYSVESTSHSTTIHGNNRNNNYNNNRNYVVSSGGSNSSDSDSSTSSYSDSSDD